jgi:hypothetical protein
MRNLMKLVPWLFFVWVLVGCTKPQPPVPPIESPRLVALEAKVTELSKELARLQDWAAKQSEAQAATADLTNALAKQALAPKPKPAAGFTDCWTSYEHGSSYRNCRDAQGNTSRRNF